MYQSASDRMTTKQNQEKLEGKDEGRKRKEGDDSKEIELEFEIERDGKSIGGSRKRKRKDVEKKKKKREKSEEEGEKEEKDKGEFPRKKKRKSTREIEEKKAVDFDSTDKDEKKKKEAAKRRGSLSDLPPLSSSFSSSSSPPPTSESKPVTPNTLQSVFVRSDTITFTDLDRPITDQKKNDISSKNVTSYHSWYTRTFSLFYLCLCILSLSHILPPPSSLFLTPSHTHSLTHIVTHPSCFLSPIHKILPYKLAFSLL